MSKTITQLKREIAGHKMKIAKETTFSKSLTKKQQLNRELLALKHRKLIEVGIKAKRLSKRFGKAILKTGKKVAPIVQKQVKLIRDQQLRDDAIENARAKRYKKKKQKKSTKRKNDLGIFSNLDF